MNPIRQLISQTAIYGLSSIVGRFLNYLLVPLYTYTFSAGEYGVVSEFYAYAGFFAVFLVFGLETGYFRFRQIEKYNAEKVYATALSFLFVFNILFVLIIFCFRQELADFLQYPDHNDYLIWFAGILAIDGITALPFARLRAENRAWRFASIKMAEIAITIILNLVLLLVCPKLIAYWPDSFLARYFDIKQGVAYIFLANLFASCTKLFLLLPEFRNIPFLLEIKILTPILRYSLPMVVIGFAGMINEMLSRAILKVMLPYDLQTNLKMLGIYGACYKLSILMSLFVQAFRYAGEPFFFAHAGRSDAKKTYALVMKYFVIAGIFIFLLVTLYIDLFQYFIGAEYREGLNTVPILLLANLSLGIYINLSIWYKLSDKTGLGAWVSLAGALLTIVLNITWIPIWGYTGSAWATFSCYTFMVMTSWILGKRYYPVNYPVFKIIFYLVLGLLIYFANQYLLNQKQWNVWVSGTLGLVIYTIVVGLTERRTLIRKI